MNSELKKAALNDLIQVHGGRKYEAPALRVVDEDSFESDEFSEETFSEPNSLPDTSHPLLKKIAVDEKRALQTQISVTELHGFFFSKGSHLTSANVVDILAKNSRALQIAKGEEGLLYDIVKDAFNPKTYIHSHIHFAVGRQDVIGAAVALHPFLLKKLKENGKHLFLSGLAKNEYFIESNADAIIKMIPRSISGVWVELIRKGSIQEVVEKGYYKNFKSYLSSSKQITPAMMDKLTTVSFSDQEQREAILALCQLPRNAHKGAMMAKLASNRNFVLPKDYAALRVWSAQHPAHAFAKALEGVLKPPQAAPPIRPRRVAKIGVQKANLLLTPQQEADLLIRTRGNDYALRLARKECREPQTYNLMISKEWFTNETTASRTCMNLLAAVIEHKVPIVSFFLVGLLANDQISTPKQFEVLKNHLLERADAPEILKATLGLASSHADMRAFAVGVNSRLKDQYEKFQAKKMAGDVPEIEEADKVPGDISRACSSLKLPRYQSLKELSNYIRLNCSERNSLRLAIGGLEPEQRDQVIECAKNNDHPFSAAIVSALLMKDKAEARKWFDWARDNPGKLAAQSLIHNDEFFGLMWREIYKWRTEEMDRSPFLEAFEYRYDIMHKSNSEIYDSPGLVPQTQNRQPKA